MDIKTYIIHLERATDRKPQVEYLCAAFPKRASIVNAVNSKTLSMDDIGRYEQNLFRPHYPFELRDTEIACFLSHRKAWQNIASGNDDYALIVEDDVQLNTEIFEVALGIATAQANTTSFIRFPKTDREIPKSSAPSGAEARIFHPKIIGLGMQLQLVGRDAAKTLLDWTATFDRPVDTLLQLNWLSGVNLETIIPSGVSEIDDRLGGSTIGSKLSIAEKLRREPARFLYRKSIARLAAKKAKTD